MTRPFKVSKDGCNVKGRGKGGKYIVFQKSCIGRQMQDRSKYQPKIEDLKHSYEREFARDDD